MGFAQCRLPFSRCLEIFRGFSASEAHEEHCKLPESRLTRLWGVQINLFNPLPGSLMANAAVGAPAPGIDEHFHLHPSAHDSLLQQLKQSEGAKAPSSNVVLFAGYSPTDTLMLCICCHSLTYAFSSCVHYISPSLRDALNLLNYKHVALSSLWEEALGLLLTYEVHCTSLSPLVCIVPLRCIVLHCTTEMLWRFVSLLRCTVWQTRPWLRRRKSNTLVSRPH